MIEFIVILSLFTLGLYVAASDGFILAPVKHFIAHNILGGNQYIKDQDEGYEFSAKWKDELWKPILGCPICMVSFWGIVIFTVFYFIHPLISIYLLLPAIVCSCGVNFILFKNLMEKHL